MSQSEYIEELRMQQQVADSVDQWEELEAQIEELMAQ
jgi:hypothetical protein